ncbi:MAG: GldG family protein [SAR324 cluster bacterium]|nr:GldG family protein [SAR324 cluster bacterium]
MKQNTKNLQSTALNIFLVLVLVVAVNIIASAIFFRIDVTEEGLYTLSDGSKKVVESVKKPVTLKFYFSKDAAQVPLSFKAYGKQVKELLQEYEAVNPEKLHLEIYNPTPDSDEEEWAQKYGLTGAEIGGGDLFFMGLVAIVEENEAVMPIFDPRREENLEYDISQLILQATKPEQGKLGIVTSLPLMGSGAGMAGVGQQAQPPWAFISELEKSFELVELKASEEIPDDISIVMVFHPKGFSPLEEYNLEQFLLGGGQLAIFVDPNARVDQHAARMAQMGKPGQGSSSLPLLFHHWGIEYDKGLILADPLRSAKVSVKGLGVTPYYIWHSLSKSAFNSEIVATKDLQNMLLPEPGSFRLTKVSPLKLTPLISASKEAGSIEAYLTAFTGVMQINEKVKADGKEHNIAAILKGELTSAFEKLPDGVVNPEHIAKGQGTIFIMADVDFIADPFSVDRFEFLGQAILQPKNDNLAFGVNVLDFLGGANELMEVRSRAKFQRPFIRFGELERQAQGNYQRAESELELELKALQNELEKINQGGDTQLSQVQVEQIKDFRDKEKSTKSKLRQIRKLLRKDIELEQNLLILLNLLLMPMILAIFGTLLYRKRFHRMGRGNGK